MAATSPPHTFSLRLTLLAAMVGLVLASTITIIWVSQHNGDKTVTQLSVALGNEISRSAAAKVHSLLSPAQAALSQFQLQAQRGLLRVDDIASLSDALVERLRSEPNLAWLSYGDQTGRFTGAFRREDGKIGLNRSWIEPDGTGKLIEEFVSADGTRELSRTSNNWDFDSRKRPWYQLAQASTGLTWVEPYPWWNDQGLGISAVMPLVRDGQMIGAFTADFFLKDVSDYLIRADLGESGRAFLLTSAGRVLAGPPGGTVGDPAAADTVLDAVLRSLSPPLAQMDLNQPLAFRFVHGGVDYGVTVQRFDVPGGIHWATVLYVRGDELFGFVRRNLWWTSTITTISVLIALGLAWLLAERIARPLAVISEDLAKVARFDLSPTPSRLSHIRELAIVSDAVARMKASVRSFARYVPVDVVRDTIAHGKEATLSAESRVLTVFFSDMEGFSRMCEILPPSQLVETMREYFSVIDANISSHRGTVDKFIGDGVLAFFNAPQRLEKHTCAACRSALIISAGVRELHGRHQDQGVPATRTRIGLHVGPVLVGNIGTDRRLNYTAVGDVVNVTYGLQLLNKVYGTYIIVSDAVQQGSCDDYEFRRLDRVQVKGRMQNGPVYELLGKKGEVDPAVLAARDCYEEALEDYLARRFDEAAAGFNEAVNLRPEDRAARVMSWRAQRYADVPPGPEWNGLYVPTESAEIESNRGKSST